MEIAKSSRNMMKAKTKQALILWLEGFREACCLHRVVILCHRSRKLLFRTGQCFLLNGLIFLGSLIFLNTSLIPALKWILPNPCPMISSDELCSSDHVSRLYSFLHLGLVKLFYVFWFYPLYILSLLLSNLWYNDIAKYGFEAMEQSDSPSVEPSKKDKALIWENISNSERPAGLGGVMIGIGEQVYSMLLLTFFFLEVYVTGFVPYIGKALNFLLLSWMYAYYCYEYKWNFSEVPLDKRLDFFESNWAFFAGFGSPCVLAVFLCSPLVSYAVMAVLFPLFVLTATGSGREKVIFTPRKTWKCAGLGRLPIFYAADMLSMWALSLFRMESLDQVQDNKQS